MSLSALQEHCSQNTNRCANPALAMHGVGCSICPAPRGESNGIANIGCFRESISRVTYMGKQMRKQWQWPWAPWLRLLPCQLVAWLKKTTVAYQKHCADITLPDLMENINNLVGIWNALRPENKHRGSSVNWISYWRFFSLLPPHFQCCLSPVILSNVSQKRNS